MTGQSVQETTGGGYIAVGLRAFGWACIGCRGRLVLDPIGGDVIPSGFTDHGPGYLVKTDGAGNLLWEKGFGPDGLLTFTNASAFAVRQTADGGYIVAGRSFPDWPIGDAYLIKFD